MVTPLAATTLAFLLQGEPTAGSIARVFAALLLILTIYTGAWLFTYWISKDE